MADVIRTKSETLTFTESASKYRERSRGVTETLTFIESRGKGFERLRNVSETLVLTETLIGNRITTLAVAEIIPFTERATYLKDRKIADYLTFTERAYGTTLNMKINEKLIFNELIVVGRPKILSTEDTLSLSEQVSYHGNQSRRVSDQLNLSDRAGRVRSASSTDTLAFSETAYRGSTIKSETLVFAEVATAVASKLGQDQLVFTEVAYISGSYNKRVSETLVFNETATWYFDTRITQTGDTGLF